MFAGESYEGEGRLCLENGDTRPCMFSVLHEIGPPVRFDCIGDLDDVTAVSHLEGVTSTGSRIRTDANAWHHIFENRRITAPIQTNALTFLAARTILGDSDEQGSAYRFDLTNFRFDKLPAPNQPLRITFSVCSEQTRFDVLIESLPDYVDRWSAMRWHKRPVVTSVMTVVASPSVSRNQMISFVDDFNYLLSVKNGCRVEWAAAECFSALGATCWREFGQRRFGPFTPLPVDSESNIRQTIDVPTMARACLPVLRERKQLFPALRVLDHWLDARHEGDTFTASRAIKQVIVIEMLKTMLLYDNAPPDTGLIIPENVWARVVNILAPTVQQELEANGINGQADLSAVADPKKWMCVNRRSFASDLRRCLQILTATENKESIRLFVESRNKLVHEGRFAIQADATLASRYSDGPKTQVEEFIFVVSFVDRVILRLVGWPQSTQV